MSSTPAEGGGGKESRVAREYIEDLATGRFYRLDNPNLLRKAQRALEQRKEVFEFELESKYMSFSSNDESEIHRGS